MTTQLQPGTIIDDRYELISLLGEGGMGSVYLAKEIELDRQIALKVLQLGMMSDADVAARFDREGKVLASLRHENVVSVFRFGIWQKQFPYLAMELLSGKTLRAYMVDGGLGIDDILGIVMQICAAMQAAHDMGVIHRDLKPDNVMVLSDSPFQVKVFDFGLSALSESSSSQHLTQTGALIGSVHYMSPEQCLGRRADHRSDIYSLGCMLYELIADRPPFSCDNPIGLIHKHAQETPEALSSSLKFPDGLDVVVFKALSKDPAMRQQSMREFANELQVIQDGQGAVFGSLKSSPNSSMRATVAVGVGLSILLFGAAVTAVNKLHSVSPSVKQKEAAAHTILKGRALKSQFSRLPAPASGEHRRQAVKSLLDQLEQQNDGSLTAWEIERLYDEYLSDSSISESERFARLNHCLSIPQVTKHNAVLANIWILYGRHAMLTGRLANAERAFRTAEEIADKGRDRDTLCDVQWNLCEFYLEMNRPKEALKAALLCRANANPDNTFQQLTSCAALASAQVAVGEVETSKRSFVEFRDSLARCSPGVDVTSTCMQVCSTVQTHASQDLLLDYLSQMIETVRDSRNNLALRSLLVRKAEVLFDQKEYSQALPLLQEALQVAEKSPFCNLAIYQLRYGECLSGLKRFNDARTQLKKAATTAGPGSYERLDALTKLCLLNVAQDNKSDFQQCLAELNETTISHAGIMEILFERYLQVADALSSRDRSADAAMVWKCFIERSEVDSDSTLYCAASLLSSVLQGKVNGQQENWSRITADHDLKKEFLVPVGSRYLHALDAAGRYEAARDVCLDIIKHLTNDTDTINYIRLDLATIYFTRLKDSSSAQEVLRTIIREAHSNLLKVQATQYLGQTLVIEKRFDDALKVFATVKLPDPIIRCDRVYAVSYYQVVSGMAVAYRGKGNVVQYEHHMKLREQLRAYLNLKKDTLN